MVYSVQQIKYDILAYIKEFGEDFDAYYVGVSADPMAALLDTHKVDKDKDPWLYKQALTFQAAITVQDYFLSRLRTDGEPAVAPEDDVAKENMDCVYVYKKSNRTSP